ncbi:adenylate/guanylate cyclase domain-containing protein [Shimia sp. R9_2]|uniref:adenylate/guanylate cyclase domain-containing protein n=1 Tax=Shimia sp. R9_2 TaxID=2821112 RepID=UPI001ADC2712|nr:adenylate/guanylate cyclase domain-containing protein [Shimia sp. R9_2]
MTGADRLNHWLISEGRLLGDEAQIVKAYCEGLVKLGVPLSRARIAQNYASPLLSAWGIIWSPKATKRYTVPAAVLATGSWRGSPFEYVVTHSRSLRKRLNHLDLSTEHPVYAELAQSGATDFLAVPLEHGNGSIQGTSFTTNAETGFSERHIFYIENTCHALAAALEPIAVRHSQTSLLQTYLGRGPAKEIERGHIKRGEHHTVSAAILFADLCNFTSKAQALSEADSLLMMGDYFELVVPSIQEAGGDVLKFMGDGILAIFDIDNCSINSCKAAAQASRKSLIRLQEHNSTALAKGQEIMEFAIGIDFGQVTFGNIGGPNRLDFTVVGPTVNVASRVQELYKNLDKKILVTQSVAQHLPSKVQSAGRHLIRGLPEEIEVFTI